MLATWLTASDPQNVELTAAGCNEKAAHDTSLENQLSEFGSIRPILTVGVDQRKTAGSIREFHRLAPA